MPSQYRRSNTTQELQIKALMTARHFRYCRVPVISPCLQIVFPADYWREVGWLDLPEYQDYLDGNYFPPIEVLPLPDSPNHSTFGTQWGVFATENIPAGTFIG